MEVMIVLYVFALISSAGSILINPGEIITDLETNCSGKLDYFLCNCLNSSTTVDILLSPGYYNFTNQSICLLENKTNVSITGNNTIIECIEPFSITFMAVQNVTISNIKMINCGDLVNDIINQTIDERLPLAYFGSGFRFALMFYNAINVTISELTMLNTLGYGIVAFNMMGSVSLSKLHIENTTFENDPKCIKYKNNKDNFHCSGSGLLFAYFNSTIMTTYNTTLNIDQSSFKNNKNFLPFKEFSIMVDIIETSLYQVPIPIQGAGSIAIFYILSSYDVNTIITDTLFHSNSGTLSPTIAVASVSTTTGKTYIKNCSFFGNSKSDLYSEAGISFYYLLLRNVPSVNTTFTGLKEAEMLTIMQCNFTHTFGESVHIETIFSNFVLVVVRIEQCTFSWNMANTGSAVHAINHIFDGSLGSLTVHLVNVHAENNTILPHSTIQHSSNEFISGVFSSEDAQFIFNCSHSCSFANNLPSVYYGLTSSLTLSGNAVFYNNSARCGGALRLLRTVAFITENSEIYFYQNSAAMYGGAINIYYYSLDTQKKDVCPIQFIGLNNSKLITHLHEIDQLNVNITFNENTVGTSNSLQSIYASIFYTCTWYPNSLIQINPLGLHGPVVNGTRLTVYNKIFNFIPKETSNDQIRVAAYLPCPCNENNYYDSQYCLSAAENKSFKLDINVTLGQSFKLYLTSLDEVGSVGYAWLLYSAVSDVNSTTSDETLVLANNQYIVESSKRNTCVPFEYTISGKLPEIPEHGILTLAYGGGPDYKFYFNFVNCSIGFSLQRNKNECFACACSEFFASLDIEDFSCDSLSGKITSQNDRSWLSVVKDKVEYTKLCSSVYCNSYIKTYALTDYNILYDNNHTGRACGGCVDDYGRIFGSNSCRRCSNAWLATILLYDILGIILVMILHLLKLTVTMGTINGLIFFCNVMSINERLFFNTEESQFLFLWVFISLINLDLGFEMCFYNEMTQIVKIGLQFVFPVYLWLLVTIIIILGRHYYQGQQTSSHSTAVLATFILLSYSKLLCATVSVFSSVTIHYTSKESNFSSSQQLFTWQPDPNIEYLKGGHIVLFIIALVFVVFFITPFAFAMTFPNIILRSKKMSRLFPLLDCFYAPYKDKHHYWFGVRIIVLIVLSGMESVVFLYQEQLLLLSIVIVLVFTIVQAYIDPFKQTLINILDLLFMTVFTILSAITLYLFPTTSGYEEVNVAVSVLGYVAFFFFCLVVFFHISKAVKDTKLYKHFVSQLQWDKKLKISKLKNHIKQLNKKETCVENRKPTAAGGGKKHSYCYYQESLLEYIQ